MKSQCTPFQYTPKTQSSFTTRYQVPVDVAGGKLQASVTYSWTDKQYSSSYAIPQTEPGAWLGGFGLLNADLSLAWLFGEDDKTAAELNLFGTNLTNRIYRISDSDEWNFLAFRSSIYGEPRIVGLKLSIGWGE
jgi:iron complex outermembrane receptor protein